MDFYGSDYTTPIAVTPAMAKMQIWKSMNQENSISLSYNDEYEYKAVLRSTSPNGSFTVIARTRDFFYTDSTAVKGVQYYYKAYAYRYIDDKFYYSGYSNVIPMTFN